ncbi:MAG TPA: toxin-antitoxin system HicB family antitoxin [Acidimicrobiia bacterium]|jgi:hypothetical protein
MDLTGVIAQVEAAATAQLDLASGDPAVEEAGAAILAALGPALRQAAIQLAELAAIEVAAQLESMSIDVVIRDGEPSLVVRSTEPAAPFSGDDLEARITVRLPERLKMELEEAAGELGDSVNAYVIKRLATSSGVKRRGNRVTKTFRT